MLKLYIYGYLNRTRSSRRLEVETHRNIEVIWLMRHLKPDFKTIADFRRDNRGAFKSVFREFVVLCRRLDLFGRELLAVDGTRIKAVNSKERNFTKTGLQKDIKRSGERLETYLKQLEDSDHDDSQMPCAQNASKLADKIAHFRKVIRYEDEAVLERMAKRLAERPDSMNKRRESVEHPFGTIKQWMNQGAFLMRRIESVRAEFSLTALAYNITRAINLVGIKGLMAAVRT